MLNHRAILLNFARAVQNSSAVLEYCQTHYGCGLYIQVGAYADKIPAEFDAPFLWIFTTGESPAVNQDECFSVSFAVGVTPLSVAGEQVVETVLADRTADANGLVVHGTGEAEELRDLILAQLRAAPGLGGRIVSFTRSENDLVHQPLEWALFEAEIQLDLSLEETGA